LQQDKTKPKQTTQIGTITFNYETAALLLSYRRNALFIVWDTPDDITFNQLQTSANWELTVWPWTKRPNWLGVICSRRICQSK